MSSKEDTGRVREKSHRESSYRRSGETQKPSSRRTLRKTDRTELVQFNESFGDGRRTPAVSSENRIPSTSGMTYQAGKLTVGGDSSALIIPVESNTSKLSRVSKITTHSDVFAERTAEYIFPENADEVINFSFEGAGFDRTHNNSVRCEAEMLRLGEERKSSYDITAKSDTILTDSLFGEMNSQGTSVTDEFVGHENVSQPTVTSQTRRKVRFRDLIAKAKSVKIPNLWSNADLFTRPQVVAFLTKIRKKKEEKQEKKYRSNIHYLDPPVSSIEDLETKEYLGQFYFHLLQLIFVTIISMGMMSSSMFYFSDITTKLFFDSVYIPRSENKSEEIYDGTLREVRTIQDFWSYAEGTLVRLLYWDFSYYKNDSLYSSTEDETKMFGENQIMGVARIRQVRVKRNSCKIHPIVRKFFDSCYDYYSVFSENNKPITRDNNISMTTTAWLYTDAGNLSSTPHWGEISIYGGGGYYLDLAKNKSETVKMLKELREERWVTRATRAIFIDFNIYNANVNLFCICRIILEFPPVGGIIAMPDFQSLKLIRYLTVSDFFILGLEFLYSLFVIVGTWETVRKIVKERSGFLTIGYNYLNLIILFLSYLCMIVGVVLYVSTMRRLPGLENTHKFVDLTQLKNLQIFYNNIIAGLVFFCWVKLFLFFNFTKTLEEFRRTLKLAFREIVQFLPIFLSMFLAFTFLAHLLFGNQMKGYCTVLASFMSLLQAFLGGFSYSQISEANRLLGPIFFAVFVFFIFFVLMNVFIAIFSNSYMTVKSQIIPRLPRSGDYVRRALVNCIHCCRPYRKRKSYPTILRRKMLFDDLKKTLGRAGFRENEIEIFFHKYNINCKNFLYGETKARIMKDIELKRINLSENSEQYQINLLRRRLDDYRERMDQWEMKLQPVIDKVDIIVNRL